MEVKRILVEAVEGADDRLDHPARIGSFHGILDRRGGSLREGLDRLAVGSVTRSGGIPTRSVVEGGIEGLTARDSSSGMGEGPRDCHHHRF